MSELDVLLNMNIEAERIYKILSSTDSMSTVAETVEGLSENMAKLVLKKFVYSVRSST